MDILREVLHNVVDEDEEQGGAGDSALPDSALQCLFPDELFNSMDCCFPAVQVLTDPMETTTGHTTFLELQL